MLDREVDFRDIESDRTPLDTLKWISDKTREGFEDAAEELVDVLSTDIYVDDVDEFTVGFGLVMARILDLEKYIETIRKQAHARYNVEKGLYDAR